MAWSVASLLSRASSSRLVARARPPASRVGFFSQISPAGCGRRPGTRPGPDRDRGPGRVRRSRWIQDLLTNPRPRFNMAATQRARTAEPAIRLPLAWHAPPSCLRLQRVFKDTGQHRQTSNPGRHLLGDGRRNGVVTGALLYSSRRSSRASAIAAHRGEPTGKRRGNHLFA
jgi:hypothetical protein